MKLGAKEQVLLAIYTEYQKDLPNMTNVNNTALNMDIDVFHIALEKLQNEEYVKDVAFFASDNNRFYTVDISKIKLTKNGIDFVEKCFGIKKELTAEDKLKYIIKQCGIYGYKALKDFGSTALSALTVSVLN